MEEKERNYERRENIKRDRESCQVYIYIFIEREKEKR